MKASEDVGTVAKAAAEALTRPQHYLNYDHATQYGTHGEVASWADRGDDLVAESNYHVMLRDLEGAAEDPDDVLDRSAGHFLYSSLRVIFVRVYRGDWTAETIPNDATDTALYYTTAFLCAVDLAAALIDYPLLDESDFFERESAAWDAAFEEAIDSTCMGYNDSPGEETMFYSLLTRGRRNAPGSNEVEYIDQRDRYSHGKSDPDYVDFDMVAEWYKRLRDEHFEWLAARHWAAIQEARHVNDIPLF